MSGASFLCFGGNCTPQSMSQVMRTPLVGLTEAESGRRRYLASTSTALIAVGGGNMSVLEALIRRVWFLQNPATRPR